MRREISAEMNKRKKNHSAAHPAQEMSLVSQRALAMAFGEVVKIQLRSSRVRLRRKKSMGVCRRWSQATAVLMRPLPRRAAM